MRISERIREAFSDAHAPAEAKRKALYAVEARRKTTVRRRVALAFQIACACLAGALIIINVQIYGRETAYVSLDVNPSISLAINDFGRVIAATAYGEQSTAALNSARVKDQPYREAVESLLDTDVIQRSLADGNALWICIQANDPMTETQMELSVQAAAESALSAQHPDTMVTASRVTEEVRIDAEDAGVTAARYIAISELQELDPSATIDNYRDATIGEIHEETELHHADQASAPVGPAEPSSPEEAAESPQAETQAAETTAPAAAAASGHGHQNHHGTGHE